MRTIAIVRTLIVAGSLLVTAACASSGGEERLDSGVAASAVVAATAAPTCQYTSPIPYRTVHVDEFVEECMAPRLNDPHKLRVPFKKETFLTACAVTLGAVDPPEPGSPCELRQPSPRPALQRGDRMLITMGSDGMYYLTRARGVDFVTFPLPNSGSGQGGTTYLSGDYKGVTYVAYIMYRNPDMQGKFEKYYRFEVFDSASKDPVNCELHKPSNPTFDSCDSLGTFGGAQTGTSTGGEPPVK